MDKDITLLNGLPCHVTRLSKYMTKRDDRVRTATRVRNCLADLPQGGIKFKADCFTL